MSDLFQRFNGFGKCSAFIFISNKDSFYMQISGKPALFVVFIDEEDLVRTEIIMISYLDLFILMLSNEVLSGFKISKEAQLPF